MTEKTEKNLAYAFAAESKASVRNGAFARKADMENYPQIANSDQKLAAIITPAAKPSMPSSTFLLMVLKKKTSAAPNAVTNQVNNVAIRACNTVFSPTNQSTISRLLSFFKKSLEYVYTLWRPGARKNTQPGSSGKNSNGRRFNDL